MQEPAYKQQKGRLRMCGALDSTVCKQSAQPDECLLHLVECRVTLREIKWFLLCVECTCSLTHEDRPRSSLNGKRLSLTNLKKNFKIVTENLLQYITIYELVAENLLFI